MPTASASSATSSISGRASRYRLFAIDDDSGAQRGRRAAGRAARLRHDVGMSAHHLVLAEFPFVVNPFSFLLHNPPFIRNYR